MENLRILLFTTVGYNTCNELNPWDPSLLKINPKTKLPELVSKYYDGYKCIDRLIILA